MRSQKISIKGSVEITDLVNLALLDTSILQNLLNRLHRFLEQFDVEFFKLGSCEGIRKVIPILETFDFDLGALLNRENSLRALDRLLQLAHGALVLGDVCAGLLLVGFYQVVDDTIVEVFSTKVGISCSGENLVRPVLDGEQRDIERSPSEIVYDDLGLGALLVETVC